MHSDLYLGSGLIMLAGLMAGSAAVPMKYATRWKWENIWVLFNTLALVVIPGLVVWSSVPQAWEAYHAAKHGALAFALLLGLGWGVGSTLCGIGYTMLGIGLGMSVVLGLAATVGSALPLAVLFPERLVQSSALALYAGIAVMLAGLILSAQAGRLRQAMRKKEEITAGADIAAFGKGDIRIGLVISIVAGVLSSMFNLGLIFGDDIRLTALRLGASSTSAVNTLWLPVTVAGSVAIALYCSYLLTKNRTWALYFSKGCLSHWFLVFLMAILYTGSISIYGVGAVRLGKMGAVMGFPAYMSMMIFTGNAAGLLTGEWKGSQPRAYVYELTGMFALIAAIVIIAAGNQALR